MKLVIIIITTVFAFLGALMLMNELSEKIERPRAWLKYNHKRRIIILIVLGLVAGSIRGTYLWKKKEAKKNAIIFLMDIESKLILIDSIISNLIISREINAPFKLLNKLAEELITYGITQRRIDEQGMEVLSAPDWQSYLGKRNGTILENSQDKLYTEILQWSKLGDERMDIGTLYELKNIVGEAMKVRNRIYNEYAD